MAKHQYRIYVDGSFINGATGYGAVVLKNGEVVDELSGAVGAYEAAGTRQVAGELIAVKEALKWCLKHAVEEVSIYYDYLGIEKWARSLWKTNQPLTKEYARFVRECPIKVRWHKVASHTGDRWNDRADALAKQGAGSRRITGGKSAGGKQPGGELSGSKASGGAGHESVVRESVGRGPAGHEPAQRESAEPKSGARESALRDSALHEAAEHEPAGREPSERESAGRESAGGESDLISELLKKTESWIEFLMLRGVEARLERVYNEQFARVYISQQDASVGIFDLYNTKKKRFSPYVHTFRDKSLKLQIETLWAEFRASRRAS